MSNPYTDVAFVRKLYSVLRPLARLQQAKELPRKAVVQRPSIVARLKKRHLGLRRKDI